MKKLIYIIIIYAFLLSGCSASGIYANYRGIEELQLVQTVGIDAQGSNVQVTTASTAGANDDPSVVLCASGFSISEAAKALQDFAPSSKMFYAHVQNLIIGEEAAAKGIGSYLDYVIRSTQMRMGTSMYIVRGGTAQSLITGTGEKDYDISKVLAGVKRDVDTLGQSHVYSCRDVSRALAETGAALVCAIEIAPTEDRIYSEASETLAVPCGYAIISNGALAGFIDGDKALAASIILGEGGVSTLPLYDEGGAKVTVEYELGSCSVKPVWAKDGSIERIEISAKLNGTVAELNAMRTTGNEEYVKQLEQILSNKLRLALEEVVELSGNMKIDFLKLGRSVKADSASRYAALGGHFEDLISTIPFEIKVDAVLERSYVLSGTVSTDGNGGK